jgi:hypothetical protein
VFFMRQRPVAQVQHRLMAIKEAIAHFRNEDGL